MKEDKYIEDLFYGAMGSTFNNAKFLRLNLTKAEDLLWNELRNKKLSGYKFRRQHPISKFVADFYCQKKKLIVEVDGGIHEHMENKIYDDERRDFLKDHGVKVIRFKNEEIFSDIEYVLDKILKELRGQ